MFERLLLYVYSVYVLLLFLVHFLVAARLITGYRVKKMSEKWKKRHRNEAKYEYV